MSKIALIMVEEYQGPWEVGQTFQPDSNWIILEGYVYVIPYIYGLVYDFKKEPPLIWLSPPKEDVKQPIKHTM